MNKKGMNGVYVGMLIIGLILGLIGGLWLAKMGIIDPAMLPF